MSRIALAIVVAIVAGCGNPPEPVGPRPPDPRQEIARLFEEIAEWSVELQLPRRLDSRICQPPAPKPRPKPCELPAEPADACREVCGLAEHICENAEDICIIAGELEGDEWAAQKCASAKAACKRAERRCCGCEDEED
jgi:hypothetical protein